MKKSLVVAVLCMVLALFSVAQEARVTMYAKDGRTISIAASAVEDYKRVGWYEGVTMWALDGRSKVVSPFKVEAEKAVGWYTEPVVMVYAADGRTKIIPKRNISAERAVGWYVNKSDVMVTMYSLDGREKQVYKSYVEREKAVGWYLNKSDVVVTMYAPDGRTKQVYRAYIDREKAVGWYTEPVVTVYAIDGRTKVIAKRNIEAEKKVGWYVNKSDVMVTMYAPDGRTKQVYKANVEAEKSVGWATEPYVLMYAPDGRTKYVLKSKVASEEKVGWSTKKTYPNTHSGLVAYIVDNGKYDEDGDPYISYYYTNDEGETTFILLWYQFSNRCVTVGTINDDGSEFAIYCKGYSSSYEFYYEDDLLFSDGTVVGGSYFSDLESSYGVNFETLESDGTSYLYNYELRDVVTLLVKARGSLAVLLCDVFILSDTGLSVSTIYGF